MAGENSRTGNQTTSVAVQAQNIPETDERSLNKYAGAARHTPRWLFAAGFDILVRFAHSQLEV